LRLFGQGNSQRKYR